MTLLKVVPNTEGPERYHVWVITDGHSPAGASPLSPVGDAEGLTVFLTQQGYSRAVIDEAIQRLRTEGEPIKLQDGHIL